MGEVLSTSALLCKTSSTRRVGSGGPCCKQATALSDPHALSREPWEMRALVRWVSDLARGWAEGGRGLGLYMAVGISGRFVVFLRAFQAPPLRRAVESRCDSYSEFKHTGVSAQIH